jgi:nitric oxide reductase NorQ protein
MIFSVPSKNDSYIINEDDQNLIKFVEEESNNSPQNLLMTGLHGCGKSELAENFAANYDRPFYGLQCAFYREPKEFFGSKGAKSGNTFWQNSQFIEAVQNKNTVILLDEINRCSPTVLNSLFSLLDDRRECYFDDIGHIKVADRVVFCATMNKGNVYTGTLNSDRALLDRFPYVLEMNYLDPEKEAFVLVKRTGIQKSDADQLVKLANALRSKSKGMGGTLKETISTRVLIKTASLYKKMGIKSFKYTIYPLFSANGEGASERALVTQTVQLIHGSVGSY